MKVVTANRLRDGVAVYFVDPGWKESLDEAAVGKTPHDVELLLEKARDSEASNLIVRAYAISVSESEGHLVADDAKERVRAVGPSVRPDLARSAES